MAIEKRLGNPKRSAKLGGPIGKLKIKAKPSTKYSPAPMSDAAKRKASRAGEEKARQYKDLPARLPSPNPARTSYSPQKMTAYDKAKAAARGKATAAKTKPKSTAAKVAGLAGKVVGRAKTTAREARDVYTAVGSAAQALRKSPQEGIPVKKTIKNIGTQVKETARAAATGKKGTTAYKLKPNPYSKEKRKAAGDKGFVFYDVTNPKKRK